MIAWALIPVLALAAVVHAFDLVTAAPPRYRPMMLAQQSRVLNIIVDLLLIRELWG